MAKKDWSLLIGKITTVYGNGGKTKFARDLGITYTELNNKLKGKSNFSLEQANKCIELLHLTKDEGWNIFFGF